MIRKPFFLLASAALIAMPAGAAAPPFETAATTAYMIDLSSGAVLYAKDADRRMPPASMAKMMTTHVAFDLIRRGELSPNKMCTVRPETWQRWHGPEAGSTMFLSPNEQVSVDNLLKGIVTLSGNDATVVLAECISGSEAAFVQLMNRQSQAMGLTTRTGAIRSAGRTMASPTPPPAISRRSRPRRSATIRSSITLITACGISPGAGRWAATSPSARTTATPCSVGSPAPTASRPAIPRKPASASPARRCATGEGIVMVVAGLTSFNQRIEESVRFMEWGFSAWQSRPLLLQGHHIGEAQVQGATVSTVGLVAPQPIAVTFPAGLGQHVRAKIVYNGPVHAPIAQGQHIADLVVETGDGSPPQVMPLAAETEVGEAGFFGRIWYGLKSLFGAA